MSASFAFITVVCAFLFSATAAQAQSSFAPSLGSAAPVPNAATSFRGLQGTYWTQVAPQEGTEAKAENLQTESGQGVAPSYNDQPQGGMTSGGTSGFSANTPTPTTVAKQPQPDQPVPHKVMQPVITIYSNPMLNNWGPPKYPLPFQTYGLHNPNPNKDALNPATFQNTPYLSGATPQSDLVAHATRIASAERTAHQLLNPSLQSAQAGFQAGTQQGADAAGGAASAQFGSNTQTYQQSLINVANELAGSPTSANNPNKTLGQAVWMVQQMLKKVYMPMAILFLLPGAVISQVKVLVHHSFTPSNNPATPEDAISPFAGILRAIIALFLIPATQLIVSYSIDVGNSLTYEVTQFVNASTVTSWESQLSLAHPIPANATGAQVQNAQQSETTMNSTMRAAFSAINTLLNGGLMVLLAYQVVIACYLLLMGPISAALFAWPGGVGKLFKPVFGNWLEALLNLVLWRFWWCVILLCMSTRIQWLMETGAYNPTSQWESYTYMAFMAMLTYVPFMALDFKTDSMIDQLLQQTGGSTGSGGTDGQTKGAAQQQTHPRTA